MPFSRQKSEQEMTPEQLSHQLAQCRERSQFFVSAAQALLFFLKEFSYNLAEIDADQFKKRLDMLANRFNSTEVTKMLQCMFEFEKGNIREFIERERDYFADREGELKTIIELLHTGLADIADENQHFNNKLYERHLKMEQVFYLDDIRKIKESLRHEVSQMKTLIMDKQRRDAQRVEALTHEVAALQSSLEKAQDASMLDGLTGASNRFAFDMQINRQIERNVVAWKPLSLLLCDIDNFKAINDQYGHQVGDRILICFVQECKTHFRNDDFIARYGGEEFAVILPGMPLRSAMKRARAFCKAQSVKQYVINPARPNETVSFTVSIGASEAQSGDTVETLIERADKALYRAKHSGRNCAVSQQRKRTSTKQAVTDPLMPSNV